MTARRSTAQARRARGFTLVEVLVALAIVAVALMGALRAVASLTDAAAELRSRSLALWSAENRLARIRIEGEWPSPGRRSTACPQAAVALICEEEVFQTPNPFFRRVEITVFDEQRSRRLARLTGFATSVP
jgi:general secretion pathway protein I